jgi:hypothetical protein
LALAISLARFPARAGMAAAFNIRRTSIYEEHPEFFAGARPQDCAASIHYFYELGLVWDGCFVDLFVCSLAYASHFFVYLV